MGGKHARTSDFCHVKQAVVNNFTVPASAEKAMRQYDTKEKAEKYALCFLETARDHREKKCITNALTNVPRGARVLDLPCGGGRLLPLLKNLGYKVTGADISTHMLEQARTYAGPFGENCPDEADNLCTANIFQTGFNDNWFDAVVCNRLFHHFPEHEVRQKALKELRRICSGRIIVSFFCDLSIDALTSSLRNQMRRHQPNDRIPISFTTFAKEANECGLVVEKWIPARPFISKQWYAVLSRDTGYRICRTNVWNTVARPKLGGKLRRVGAVAAVILIGLFITSHIQAILDPHEREVEQIARKYQDGNDHFYVTARPYLEDLRTGRHLSIIANTTEAGERIAADRSELEDSFFIIPYEELDDLARTPAWKQLSVLGEIGLAGYRFILLSTERNNTPPIRRKQQSRFLTLPQTGVCT